MSTVTFYDYLPVDDYCAEIDYLSRQLEEQVSKLMSLKTSDRKRKRALHDVILTKQEIIKATENFLQVADDLIKSH